MCFDEQCSYVLVSYIYIYIHTHSRVYIYIYGKVMCIPTYIHNSALTWPHHVGLQGNLTSSFFVEVSSFLPRSACMHSIYVCMHVCIIRMYVCIIRIYVCMHARRRSASSHVKNMHGEQSNTRARVLQSITRARVILILKTCMREQSNTHINIKCVANPNM